MVNWNGVDADVNLWLNKHFTTGRSGSSINKIIIHHNAGANLSTQDVYNIWQTREASAHYQVEVSGRIGQLVHDWDTSWNAGNWDANVTSIGIEHANSGGAAQGWPISEATRENGAHLVAALCKRYELGRPQWGKNVFPHEAFSATSCPGKLYGEYKDSYINRAQEWYDSMTGSTPAPAPAPAPTPAPAPAPVASPAADGYWGSDTTSALQQVLGTPVDGVVSSQSQAWRGQNPGLTTGWEWVSNPKGSQVIIALQRTLGVAADGLIGPGTIRALQQRMGTPQDGVLAEQSQCIIALQNRLQKGTI